MRSPYKIEILVTYSCLGVIYKYAGNMIMRQEGRQSIEITFRQPLPFLDHSFTLSAIRNDGLDARGINLMKFDGGTDADADGDGGVA